ncbi:YfhO family protein [Bifidobacterium biavatii]|uniref:YfhO family protein n=1 Tax=Bifidobacterium biavatii TaxID=762212 RepID=UPI001362AA75|nr:YfhO family protein [Bifidobacterium biavatii]
MTRWLLPACACLTGLVVLLCVLYNAVIFGDWKLSFTNANYLSLPFSSSGVKTSGPRLNDIADNVLPIASQTFQPLTFTAWLPNFGLGAPQSMSEYMSLLNWLYMLPLDTAQQLISAAKVLIAFGSMYLFVRQIGCTWRGAFISGVSYALCASMTMWHGWPHSEVSMYAPLLFLFMDKALKRFSLRYWAGYALVLGLMLAAGMPTYAAYFLYLSGAYMLFCGVRDYWAEPSYRLIVFVCGFAVAVALGAALSLPYTGSLMNSIGSNGYAASRTGQASHTASWDDLRSLLFPYLHKADESVQEQSLYVGILPIVSLPLTVVNFRRKKRVGFFAGSIVVLVLLIFTNVFDPVFALLPFVNTSLKVRIIILLDFALAVLAGINIDDVFTRCKITLASRIRTWIAGAVILCAIVVTYQSYARIVNGDVADDNHAVIAGIVALMFVAVLLLLPVGGPRILTGMISGVCALALICGSAYDMGSFASTYLPMIEKNAATVPAASSTIRYLQRNTKHQEKIVTLGGMDFFSLTNMYYGVRNITGHGFVYTNADIKAYFERLNQHAFSASPTRPQFLAFANDHLLSYLGVKYIVGNTNDIDQMESFGTPTAHDDGMSTKEIVDHVDQIQLTDSAVMFSNDKQLLENMTSEFEQTTVHFSKKHSHPRQLLASQQPLADNETVSDIVNDRNGTVSFTATVNEARYVLVNEYNDGNWAAYVDGEKTDVYKGNYLFRAVEVPAGTHHVELRYEPKQLNDMLRYSTYAAAATLALLVLGAFFDSIARLARIGAMRVERREREIAVADGTMDAALRLYKQRVAEAQAAGERAMAQKQAAAVGKTANRPAANAPGGSQRDGMTGGKSKKKRKPRRR